MRTFNTFKTKAIFNKLVGVTLIVFASSSYAGSTTAVPNVSAETIKFELKGSATMKDVLTEYMGKRLVLKLAAGDEVEGIVTAVGNSLVHISKISGKEFYDAVVSIDKIGAIRMKARDK